MALSDEDQKAVENYRSSIDPKSFVTDSYIRRVEKPWGYEIHFTPDNLPYMGKILHIDEGKQFSLQIHDEKQESWHLADGNLILLLENENGEMVEIKLEKGKGYTCKLGQKHRIKGGPGGGDVFEVSTPEIGNSYRLEDDYERTTETERSRAERNAHGS